jgi:hypothetical protein
MACGLCADRASRSESVILTTIPRTAAELRLASESASLCFVDKLALEAVDLASGTDEAKVSALRGSADLASLIWRGVP